MPGKNNKPKSSAGEPGLNTETTSGGQNPDHSMNPEDSSVAAGQLPRQETSAEKGDAALKAFEDLYGDDAEKGDVPHPDAIDVDKDNEEEDVFLSPNPRTSSPEPLKTSQKS
jgi:hypothetical protein